jgi:hypothetical protein
MELAEIGVKATWRILRGLFHLSDFHLGRIDSGLDTSADWAPAEGAARSFMLLTFREDLLTDWAWALQKVKSGMEDHVTMSGWH